MMLLTLVIASFALVIALSALFQSLENARRDEQRQAARNLAERHRLEGRGPINGHMR